MEGSGTLPFDSRVGVCSPAETFISQECKLVKTDSYRILLNEDWELEDLYEYPHALSQCYAFVYCLDSKLEPRDRDRIAYAMQNYPFKGGYSYVNIYSVLKNQIPNPDRPRIDTMRKQSPGWLDLLLNVDVAYHLAASVTALAGASVTAVATYSKAYKILIALNAARRQAENDRLKGTALQMRQMNELCIELAKNLGYKNLKGLHEHTGDVEISMKLLMSHYRRMNVLVEYQKKGKATLTLPIRLE